MDEENGDPICANCKFSVLFISDDASEGPVLKCRRYPPKILMINGVVSQTSPTALGWCGEYQEV